MTISRGRNDGSPVDATVSDVDIRSCFEERLRNSGKAVSACSLQSCPVNTSPGIDIATCIQKDAYSLDGRVIV